MAKNNQSILESHLEKAVLGVCFLFLVYALVHWGLGSPLSPSTIAEGLPPMFQPPQTLQEMDSWMLQQVQREKDRIIRSNPPVRPVPEYAKALEQQINSPVPAMQLVEMSWPRFPASMPGIAIDHERVALADLVAVIPAPEQVKVNALRVLPRRESQTGEVNAAFGVSLYPHRDLADRWAEKLRKSNYSPTIVFQDLRIERQERLPDGAWSEPVAVKVEPVNLMDQNAPVAVPTVPKYDGNNGEAVRAATENLRQPAWQTQILQPLYPDVFHPNRQVWADWRIHLPNTELSNLEGDPVSAEHSIPLAPAGTLTPGVVPTPSPSPRPMGPGGPGGIGPMGPGGPMGPMGPMGPGGPGGPRGYPTPSPAPVVRPNPTPAPAVRPATPGTPNVVTMANLPDLARQFELGDVLTWFCDTTLEDGKVYRYRVSVRLVNPVLGCPLDVKKPADAEVASVDSPWSAWSEPVSVERSLRFFLTGANPLKNEVKVTVFTTHDGQWTKHTVSATPGQSISGKEKKKIVNPFTGEAAEVPVDFGTQAVVLNVNFAKTIYRGSIKRDTVEMLYLDGGGELHTRLLDTDNDSKELEELTKQAGMK